MGEAHRPEAPLTLLPATAKGASPTFEASGGYRTAPERSPGRRTSDVTHLSALPERLGDPALAKACAEVVQQSDVFDAKAKRKGLVGDLKWEAFMWVVRIAVAAVYPFWAWWTWANWKAYGSSVLLPAIPIWFVLVIGAIEIHSSWRDKRRGPTRTSIATASWYSR